MPIETACYHTVTALLGKKVKIIEILQVDKMKLKVVLYVSVLMSFVRYLCFNVKALIIFL